MGTSMIIAVVVTILLVIAAWYWYSTSKSSFTVPNVVALPSNPALNDLANAINQLSANQVAYNDALTQLGAVMTKDSTGNINITSSDGTTLSMAADGNLYLYPPNSTTKSWDLKSEIQAMNGLEGLVAQVNTLVQSDSAMNTALAAYSNLSSTSGNNKVLTVGGKSMWVGNSAISIPPNWGRP